MKKFITVLIGVSLALGAVSLSFAGGVAGEQQEQGGGGQTQEGVQAGKKGKRGKGKRGKGKRNRDSAAQTPGAPATPQP